IGRQKISLEPATMVEGLVGLMAMVVSLCGVSSLLMSMLEPCEESRPDCEQVRGAWLFKSHWPLLHQVGSWFGDDEPADGDVANASAPSAAIRTPIPMRESLTGHTLHTNPWPTAARPTF